jgi:hypothetical protein
MPSKGQSVSIHQYEATEMGAQTQPDARDQHSQLDAHEEPGRVTIAIVQAGVAIVPAAFWGSIAWFVWGWLVAGSVAVVALVVSILTLGLLRSAREVETYDARPSRPQLRQVA